MVASPLAATVVIAILRCNFCAAKLTMFKVYFFDVYVAFQKGLLTEDVSSFGGLTKRGFNAKSRLSAKRALGHPVLGTAMLCNIAVPLSSILFGHLTLACLADFWTKMVFSLCRAKPMFVKEILW